MKELSSIEWLKEQILIRRNGIDNSIPLEELFKEAELKHEKEIKKAWQSGEHNFGGNNSADIYYGENFK
jgi:hypothetical protein